MRNPFKVTGTTISEMFKSAKNSDTIGPALPTIGAVLITPIVAPVVFVTTFFKKD
jgi:hypothetical protein